MRKNTLRFPVPWILVALALFRCGGGGGDGSSTPPPVAGNFSQADATGTWDVLNFQTGTGAGWSRQVSTIDVSGNMAVSNYQDSAGGTPGPPMIISVNAAGEVSVTSGGVLTGFHGQMSSDKKLLVGIQGVDNNWASIVSVARKRTGTTFNNADFANTSFVSHGLFSGTDNTWEWSIGTTDGSGNVTLSSRTDPSGTSGPFPNVATVSVDSDGIATNSMDNTFYGFMTDDKKVFFSVNTAAAGKYNFMVGLFTGATFIQADLAGTVYFNSLNSATLVKPGWAYGSASHDATGTGTYLTYTDSAGGAMPGPYTRVLGSSGVITDPANPSYHGQLSYNKNLTVRTGTSATSGRHQIVIGIK